MAAQRDSQSGIFETLRKDLGRGEHYQTLRKEYRDLKNFYIDEERRRKLSGKNVAARFFWEGWWLLRGLFYNLTPTRRLLLVIAIVLSGNHLTFQIGSAVAGDNGMVGFLLLLFVLILELKDKLLAHDELESGRAIQRALMPDSCPSMRGWSVYFNFRPAREVGGDLVDCIDLGGGRMAVVVADVAGKGLRAALMSSKLQATIRALASDSLTLADLCAKVNSIFYRDSIKSIFASVLYVEVRPGDGVLNFVNAGHLPPIVATGDSVRELEKGQMALGLTGTASYTTRSVSLQPGDVFVAFTDGITEATDDHGIQFGTERLIQRLTEIRHLDARSIGETLKRNVEHFTGDAPVRDDVSIIVLKRTE